MAERNDAALVPKVMSGPKLSRRSMPISSDRDVSAPLADEKSCHLVVNKTDMYHEKMTQLVESLEIGPLNARPNEGAASASCSDSGASSQ